MKVIGRKFFLYEYVKWVVGFWANLERSWCLSKQLQTPKRGSEIRVLTRNMQSRHGCAGNMLQRTWSLQDDSSIILAQTSNPHQIHLPVTLSSWCTIYSLKDSLLFFFTKKLITNRRSILFTFMHLHEGAPSCTYFPTSKRINMWPFPPFSYHFEANT